VDTVTVSGNGTYHPSGSFTPSSTGDYRWFAGSVVTGPITQFTITRKERAVRVRT
jgi:hypothetical protein